MWTLETDRLTLRPFEADDRDAVYGMYSRWEVQRFLGRSPRVMADAGEAAARIESWRALDDPVLGIRAVVARDGGRLLGTVLLKSLPLTSEEDPAPASGEIEIGWHLHPAAWGHGYASEAARAVLARGLAGGLPRVLAVTYPENEASQRVAAAIGMHDRGLTDDYYGVRSRLFEALPA